MPTITRRMAAVELTDGRVLEVRVTNADTIRYEQMAQKHKWPTMTVKEGVTTLADVARRTTAEVWCALKRTGQYDASFDQFSTVDCVDVSVDEEEADPTQPAPEAGSSLSSPGSDNGSSQSWPAAPTTAS